MATTALGGVFVGYAVARRRPRPGGYNVA
jgi:hypothetical protein